METDLLKKTVSDFLSALGVQFESIAISEGPRVVVAISSPDSKQLIGPHGEHLQAINSLVRRLMETKGGDTNFLIDVNGYHEQRLEGLRENARMLAQRARLFKHEVELPPMSSYERLVVHELFADDPEIATESRGEGKFRHIILRYKEKSAAEAAPSVESLKL